MSSVQPQQPMEVSYLSHHHGLDAVWLIVCWFMLLEHHSLCMCCCNHSLYAASCALRKATSWHCSPCILGLTGSHKVPMLRAESHSSSKSSSPQYLQQDNRSGVGQEQQQFNRDPQVDGDKVVASLDQLLSGAAQPARDPDAQQTAGMQVSAVSPLPGCEP